MPCKASKETRSLQFHVRRVCSRYGFRFAEPESRNIIVSGMTYAAIAGI